MPRTQWVLKWPGQVTIAGCQTYWTMEVAEALGAGNLSNQLFPQLARQVGAKGVTLSSPHTPHTLGEPAPPGGFPLLMLEGAWSLTQGAIDPTLK